MMGDTGSLALGGILGVLALIVKKKPPAGNRRGVRNGSSLSDD
jgi:hypothetical protein